MTMTTCWLAGICGAGGVPVVPLIFKPPPQAARSRARGAARVTDARAQRGESGRWFITGESFLPGFACRGRLSGDGQVRSIHSSDNRNCLLVGGLLGLEWLYKRRK